MLPANGDIAGPQGSPSPSVYLQAERTPHLRDYGHHPFALVTHSDLRSMLTEAFRTLRTSLLFSSPESPPKSILCTSAHPAEGKTGVAMNTAITLSQLGRRVLLIDGDMRRPTCHQLLDLPATPGLSDYLTGNAELASIIRQTAVPHLHCVPAGTAPINPAELLASSRMRATLAGFAQAFDHVVIDAPPLLGLADAAILATMASGVILVVRAEQTPREAIQQALKPLIELHVKLLGIVLNHVNVRLNGYSHYYAYHSYYRDLDAQAPISE